MHCIMWMRSFLILYYTCVKLFLMVKLFKKQGCHVIHYFVVCRSDLYTNTYRACKQYFTIIMQMYKMHKLML